MFARIFFFFFSRGRAWSWDFFPLPASSQAGDSNFLCWKIISVRSALSHAQHSPDPGEVGSRHLGLSPARRCPGVVPSHPCMCLMRGEGRGLSVLLLWAGSSAWPGPDGGDQAAPVGAESRALHRYNIALPFIECLVYAEPCVVLFTCIISLNPSATL